MSNTRENVTMNVLMLECTHHIHSLINVILLQRLLTLKKICCKLGRSDGYSGHSGNRRRPILPYTGIVFYIMLFMFLKQFYPTFCLDFIKKIRDTGTVFARFQRIQQRQLAEYCVSYSI